MHRVRIFHENINQTYFWIIIVTSKCLICLIFEWLIIENFKLIQAINRFEKLQKPLFQLTCSFYLNISWIIEYSLSLCKIWQSFTSLQKLTVWQRRTKFLTKLSCCLFHKQFEKKFFSQNFLLEKLHFGNVAQYAIIFLIKLPSRLNLQFKLKLFSITKIWNISKTVQLKGLKFLQLMHLNRIQLLSSMLFFRMRHCLTGKNKNLNFCRISKNPNLIKTLVHLSTQPWIT